MTPAVLHPVGLGAISDLRSPKWREILALFERDQDEFLSREDSFRSPEYGWPRDALHWWSRVWEYPYVYQNLKSLKSQDARAGPPMVVDLGSGVTFFPFSVARLGCDVLCLDVDPICARDMERAARVVPSTPGSVKVRLIDGRNLPLPSGGADAIYCISVLEHVPDYAHIVEEVARALRVGGLFVVTVDLDLRGSGQMGTEDFATLRLLLASHFELLTPERTVHPADVLYSDTGPYRWPGKRSLPSWLRSSAGRMLRRAIGRTLVQNDDPKLAVCGFALIKK